MTIKRTKMTGKEIAALVNEKKFIDFRGRHAEVWRKEKKEKYFDSLISPFVSFFVVPIILYLNPDGIYEIIYNKPQIFLLVDFLKDANKNAIKRAEGKEFNVDIITEATADELGLIETYGPIL